MPNAHLFLIGATHRTAPLGFREKLALGVEAEAGFASELAGLAGLDEFVVLNTCNRVEIYGVARGDAVADQVAAAFCSRQGVGTSEFARFGLHLTAGDAVHHLMSVASGLDSQMLGETEIFGQVKRAYGAAQARGTAGPVLNRLFQKTFAAVKQARTETAIGMGQVSVANVAVEIALDVFGSLEGARILLIGAGEMGEKTGRAFASRGAGQLTVSSRRLEHAGRLAAELRGAVLPFEERERRLEQWDIVVCSTSAPAAVLSHGAVQRALRTRGARPLLLIDLAMPRDIEEGAGALANVFLYNLDDLARIAEENRRARLAAADRCRAVLLPRADSLWMQLERQIGGRPAPGSIAAQALPGAAFA